jgi:hypothetical protein
VATKPVCVCGPLWLMRPRQGDQKARGCTSATRLVPSRSLSSVCADRMQTIFDCHRYPHRQCCGEAVYGNLRSATICRSTAVTVDNLIRCTKNIVTGDPRMTPCMFIGAYHSEILASSSLNSFLTPCMFIGTYHSEILLPFSICSWLPARSSGHITARY